MNRITFVTSLLLVGIFALPTSSALTTSSVKASSQTYTATELGTLSGPFSQARSINNAGNIVGEASVGDDDIHVHAFLYQDECMTDLGTFGGQFSYASAINNVGQITGHATFPGDLDAHAFIFVGGPMQDLGKLPGSGGSIGSAINDNGTVTGESREEVMIYRNGVMTDLNSVTPKDADLFKLEVAWDINDSGHIVGRGFYLFKGSRAVLLTPAEPAP